MTIAIQQSIKCTQNTANRCINMATHPQILQKRGPVLIQAGELLSFTNIPKHMYKAKAA